MINRLCRLIDHLKLVRVGLAMALAIGAMGIWAASQGLLLVLFALFSLGLIVSLGEAIELLDRMRHEELHGSPTGIFECEE